MGNTMIPLDLRLRTFCLLAYAICSYLGQKNLVLTFFSSIKIPKGIGIQAYQLKLLYNLQQYHLVFYVSLLKKTTQSHLSNLHLSHPGHPLPILLQVSPIHLMHIKLNKLFADRSYQWIFFVSRLLTLCCRIFFVGYKTDDTCFRQVHQGIGHIWCKRLFLPSLTLFLDFWAYLGHVVGLADSWLGYYAQ